MLVCWFCESKFYFNCVHVCDIFCTIAFCGQSVAVVHLLNASNADIKCENQAKCHFHNLTLCKYDIKFSVRIFYESLQICPTVKTEENLGSRITVQECLVQVNAVYQAEHRIIRHFG